MNVACAVPFCPHPAVASHESRMSFGKSLHRVTLETPEFS